MNTKHLIKECKATRIKRSVEAKEVVSISEYSIASTLEQAPIPHSHALATNEKLLIPLSIVVRQN